MSVALIWAQSVGPQPLIGRDGAIPWHVPEDFARFKELTLGHPVLMGRATWESLPRRPLPGRTNLVLSRSGGPFEGAVSARSVAEALAGRADAWVIGGAAVYTACLPLADRIELTEVDVDLGPAGPDDVRAPELPEAGWSRTTGDWLTSANGLRYRYSSFRR